MVTFDKEPQENGSVQTTNVTYYGLHDDTKPTTVGNGSCFIEMDTGKCFFFNAEAGEWVEVQSSGGGGGSSGESNLFIVGAAIDTNEWTITLDKTWNEITSASQAKKAIFFISTNPNYILQWSFVKAYDEAGTYTVQGYQEYAQNFTTNSADGYPVGYLD